MSRIVIGNNQIRVKDSYAPAAILNLTLRSNGEEEVQVMDSIGNFVPAGFTPPSDAPTLAIGSAVGLTPNKWVAYQYVYAATTKYPLVDNLVSAGGDISPRSNPSPLDSIQIPAAPGTGSKINLTVTKAQRSDLDKIWIYRTDYYDTQDEAETAAEAGELYFVAAITDDGTAGTTTYTDSTITVTGNELIENDNFPAENFQFCKYDDPYFYGVGNFPFTADVSITTTGGVTLTDQWDAVSNTDGDKWFNGRDGQTCTFEGITDGGFDGHGTFYFKTIDNFTAQLYLDIELSIVASVPYSGTTQIKIQGKPNILYRSKPHNPFAWGYVEVVGDIDVPTPYAYRFGGGQATAMEIVPILNLLKIDTEGPNRTFVFNLNGKGTPAFEESKREISSDFSTSNHWAQFSTKDTNGNTYLWFYDSKNKVICQADGATNKAVSSAVFESMRNLSVEGNDRLLSHGIYEPNLELNCIWLTTEGSEVENDLLITYHPPTNTWSTSYQREILCSSLFLDTTTNEQFIIVGSATGRIGRAFDTIDGREWVPDTDVLPLTLTRYGPSNCLQLPTIDVNFAIIDRTKYTGIWCFLKINLDTISPGYLFENGTVIGSARIWYMEDNLISGMTKIFFDKVIDRFGNPVASMDDISDYISGSENTVDIYPGATFCNCCKLFNLGSIASKKLSEIWITMDYPPKTGNSVFESPTYGLISNTYRTPDQIAETFTFTPDPLRLPTHLDGISPYYYNRNPFTQIDMSRLFKVELGNIGYNPINLYDLNIIIDNASN